jgi:flagellar assembly protein FliH
MLAKLIRAGAAKPFSAMEWPTASAFVENAAPHPADAEGQPGELVQLRSEIAELQSELAAARADAERRVQEALAAGRREADQSARRVLEQQVEAEVSKLRQMIRDLSASGAKLRRQAEEDLVRLSVAVARRILHRELTIDPDALSGLIKAAFDRLDQREIHQIRTDPDSAATVRKLVEGLGLPRTVTVLSDPSLRPGSLLIETARGQLDASIETQLGEIQRGFIDIVQHS